MGSSNDNDDNNQDKESLLTPKALQLSLSPPRCPPYGTAHRTVLLGGNPSWDDPYAEHYNNQAYSDYNKTNNNLRQRIIHNVIYNARVSGIHLPHPHLAVGPEVSDQITRFLGTMLPLSWQNHCRDSGGFRSLSDNPTSCSLLVGAVANPRAAMRFLKLTKKCQTIRYSHHHESQFIDMYFPNEDGTNSSRDDWNGMVFFVHGGAWGSGKPWFYRLIADSFLKLNMAVAIVGYRVYPFADVNTQVKDLMAAYQELSKRYPDLCGPNRSNKRPIGFCVMGHSSGAHISLLMIVEQVKQMIHHVEQQQQQEQQKQQQQKEMFSSMQRKQEQQHQHRSVDLYIGISGPYDISHHFDYEAARGVEELSPMKAANGYTREQFRLNTPTLRLQDFLATIVPHNNESARLAIQNFFPRTLLVHGIEDETVPFTATSEAARVLRSCGVKTVEEYYAPLTGHGDAVIHLMIGGRVRTSIVDWMTSRNLYEADDDDCSSSSLRSRL